MLCLFVLICNYIEFAAFYKENCCVFVFQQGEISAIQGDSKDGVTESTAGKTSEKKV